MLVGERMSRPVIALLPRRQFTRWCHSKRAHPRTGYIKNKLVGIVSASDLQRPPPRYILMSGS
jgi:hypothetical protein